MSYFLLIQVLGILLGDFLVILDGVFLDLPFFTLGLFPKILEFSFFDEFKLRLLKYIAHVSNNIYIKDQRIWSLIQTQLASNNMYYTTDNESDSVKILDCYLKFDVSVHFFCHRGIGPLIASSMRVRLFSSFMYLRCVIVQMQAAFSIQCVSEHFSPIQNKANVDE